MEEDGINPFEETVDPAFAATLTQGTNKERVVYAVSSANDPAKTQEFNNPKDAARAFMDIPAEARPDVVRTMHGEEHGAGGVGQVIGNTTVTGLTINRSYGNDEEFKAEVDRIMRSQAVEKFEQRIEGDHAAIGMMQGSEAAKHAGNAIESRLMAFGDTEMAAKHGQLIEAKGFEERGGILRQPETGLLRPEIIEKWAAVDAHDFRNLETDKDKQWIAGVDLMENAKRSPEYGQALREFAPEVYTAAEAMHADDQQRILAKEQRKGDFGLGDIPNWTDQYESASAARDTAVGAVANITDDLAEEGVAPDNASRVYMQEASTGAALDVDAFRHLKTDDERAAALQAMRGNVDRDQQYARELAETAPGIRAEVDAIGQDRTALVENSIAPDIVAMGGREAAAANDEQADRPTPAGIEPDKGPGLFERLKEGFASWARVEEDRAQDLEAHLKRTFHVAGNEYHYKDKTNPKESLAFTDLEHTVVTKHNDPKAIEGMLKLAESKGWDKLTLKGSDDFKREAWIMASAQGFEVSGYQPTEIDKERMRQMREGLQKNQVGGTQQVGGEIAGRAAEGGKAAEDPRVTAYRGSEEYGKTVDHVAKTLAEAGYPVDEKFKKAIGDHLANEYAQGREYKPGKGVERATPVERTLGPSESTTRNKDVEIKAPVYADRSR